MRLPDETAPSSTQGRFDERLAERGRTTSLAEPMPGVEIRPGCSSPTCGGRPGR